LLAKENKLQPEIALFLSSVERLRKNPERVAVLLTNLELMLWEDEWKKALVFKGKIKDFAYVETELKKNFRYNWFLIYLLYLFQGKRKLFKQVYRKELAQIGLDDEYLFLSKASKMISLLKEKIYKALDIDLGLEEEFEEYTIDEDEVRKYINSFLYSYASKFVPMSNQADKLTVEDGYKDIELKDFSLVSENAYLSFLEEFNKHKDIGEYKAVMEEYLKGQVLYPFSVVF
jgi:hypothetical protein